MAGSRTTRAGTKRAVVRRRAVGTRDRIVAHLAAINEIADPTGMASTRLAEAVGYPGSSVAFAQLLSGMERDGLIAREVRGKRTYRITLSADAADGAAAQAPGARAHAGASVPGANGTNGANGANGGIRAAGGRHAAAGAPDFGVAADATAALAAGPMAGPQVSAADLDYDELARRLLIQVVRRLAASPTDLEQTVAGLEQELVTAWTRHGTLTAENVRLREQLRETQRHLGLLRQRYTRLEITDELDETEVVVLDQLLTAQADGEDAAAGQRAG